MAGSGDADISARGRISLDTFELEVHARFRALLLHFTLVFVVAATALRSSELLSLRWADILWEERKIRIVKVVEEDGR